MVRDERENHISSNLRSKSRAKIQAFAERENLEESDLVSYFECRLGAGTSVRKLSGEIGLRDTTLARFLRRQGIVLPSQAEASKQVLENMHQDPGFKVRQAEGIRQSNKRRWQDSEFRERQAEGARQIMNRNWQDPAFGIRVAEGVKQNWQDPAFRERHAEAVKRELSRRWQDPAFRERNTSGIRRARLDPASLDHYVLSSIQGQRLDLPCYSFSVWEANLARTIISCGRDFLAHEPFDLTVPENYAVEYQLPNPTGFILDFLSLDRKGNYVGYEIMAHPLENPVGWLKTELFSQQYPEIRLVIVTNRFYQRLRRHFETQVNNSPSLIGWENYQDNIRLNPQKWSV